jgi:hypothetical protein
MFDSIKSEIRNCGEKCGRVSPGVEALLDTLSLQFSIEFVQAEIEQWKHMVATGTHFNELDIATFPIECDSRTSELRHCVSTNRPE